MLAGTFELVPANSDKLPALWALIHAPGGRGGGGVVLAPVCAQPGHLHVVSTGYLRDQRVDTSLLTKDEVQWLSVVAKALEMCTDTTSPIKTPTMVPLPAQKDALGDGSHLLAAMIENASNTLHGVWRPTSSAPLWVCKQHFDESGVVS